MRFSFVEGTRDMLVDMLMAQTTSVWTLADLDRLPDDGNSYELIDGELFVTPAPTPAHECLATELRYLLEPYILAHALGRIYTPHSVVRTRGSQVEPDLMVRPPLATMPEQWEAMPTPLLVVEVLSRTTRQRDGEQKRNFYLAIGVPEYWMVDRWERTIQVVRPNAPDVAAVTELVWHPTGAAEPLLVNVADYFRAALKDGA